MIYTIRMDFFTRKEVITINSNERTNLDDSHSDFSYHINLDPNAEYSDVVVLSASIPKTYYNVYTGSSFVLEEDGQQVTIDVPGASYTKASLKNTIQSLLNINSPHSYTYVVTYPNINITGDDGKLTFTVSDNVGIQPKLIFNYSFFQQLGFNSDTTYEFESDILKSVNVANISKESTLFIRSDIVQNRNNNILQDVITTGDPSFSYVIYQATNTVEHSKRFSKMKSNVYRFWITDENNQTIDLNGSNVVFTIMIYKKANLNRYIKGYIKLWSAKNLQSLEDNNQEE